MEQAAPKGVALGGFMATGKSTVGPLLAQRLGLAFWDLDLEIERVSGSSIADIFQEHGEPFFRELERRVLWKLVACAPCVLSLGGGSLHVEANRLALHGFDVVVLHLPWETIENRLQFDSQERPLVAQAKRLYQQREPGYARSGMLIDVEKLAPAEVVDLICERVGLGAI